MRVGRQVMCLLGCAALAAAGPAAAQGVGEGVSPAFALYLGPGFIPPEAVGVGEGVSPPFALYLGVFSQSYALSPPFVLDTRLPAAFAGVIRDQSTGDPLAAALVELFLGPEPQQAMMTNEAGEYAFYATVWGDYVVRASHAGYAMATTDLLPYAGGATIEADLDLPPLPSQPVPDFALGPADLTYTVLQSGALALTAMVHNEGGVVADDVRVRFYDASTGSGINDYVPITPDVILPNLAPGDAVPASVDWTPPSGHQRFYVFADPLNAVVEPSEINNGAPRDLGALGRVPPRVTAAGAQYDGLPDPRLIGRFLTGIDGAENRFTATVSDPDGDVARVQFDFDGTVLEDTSPAGGWSVVFDTGTLPPGNLPLTVTAFDAAGLVSEPFVVTLVVDDWPAWMQGRLRLAGLPVSFGLEPGYLHFTLQLFNDAFPGEPILFFEDLIDPDVLIVGATSTSISMSGLFEFSYPLNPGSPWKVGGTASVSESAFDRPLEGWQADFSATISADGSVLESVTINFPHTLTVPGFPEVTSPPLLVYGIRIEVGLSMDVLFATEVGATLEQNLTVIDASLQAQLGAQINGVLRVSDPIRFARLELILSPRLLLGPDVHFLYPPGEMTLTGAFSSQVGVRLVGSLIWGTVTQTFVELTWGPWEWTYPRGLPLAARPQPVLAELDPLALPEVFPYPAAASGAAGEVGVAWVEDVDPAVPRVDPEVFFALRDTTGVWGTPERVTANDRFETIPVVALLPDGRALAAWVQSSLLENEVPPVMSLSSILDRQDVWYAVRGETGWSAPAAVVEEAAAPYRADGLPALAPLANGNALLLWARSMGDSALAPGSSEIFYATFSGAAWSAPARLTDDQANDTGPAVCATRADSAVAVWLREDPPGSGSQEMVWSTWDGAAWDAPQTLRAIDRRLQGPALAAAPGGDPLAAWVEVETLADSTLRYHLLAASMPPGQSAWSVEEVLADSLFVETPIALVDQRNIAVVSWRGNDGYDGDLKVALKDLDEPGAPWTLPRSVTADSLTDWMATAALDRDNNLHFIDLKSDLADTTGAQARGNFFGGLSVVARGISNDLTLDEQLNFGYRALSADLRLAAGSVELEDPFPTAGDTVLVHARVENIGDVQSAASAVRFYEGHPDSGGVAIGADVVLAAIDPDSAAVVAAPWVAGEGTFALYAVADPDGSVPEQNEANNLAGVGVGVLPDLVLAALDVSEANPAPGDSVDLTAVVRNDGGASANGFSVRLARFGGTLATVTGLSLAPADSVEVAARFAAAAGVDTLSATADPDSLLPDPDRSDNGARLELRVLPDLWAPADSIRYAGSDSAGTLGAWVKNAGGVASPSFLVTFYRGNPAVGGTLLDSLRVGGLAARDSVRVETEWLAPLGLSTIYAVVDAGAEVDERDEGNNESFTDVIRGALADLTVLPGSLVARHEPGNPLTLEAAFANIGAAHALAVAVEFFRGDPDSAGVLIGDRLLIAVDIGDTTVVSVPWADPDSLANPVFAVVDRANTIPELDEGNNRLWREFGPITAIQEVPEAPVLPAVLALHPAFPNPFNAHTTIRFDLPRGGPASLAVYNAAGRLVRRLVAGVQPAGFYSVDWDGAGESGRVVASGVYFYRLEAGGKVLRRKMVLLK